jgi:hypothetical protein
LKASGLPVVTSETSFGTALCKIADDGCPSDNCFCNEKMSWGYFHLQDGKWVSADSGIGGYKPADKAVEGLAWTGFDASFNPLVTPPVVSFDDIKAGKAPSTLPVTGGSNSAPTMQIIGIIAGLSCLAGYTLLWRQARAAR